MFHHKVWKSPNLFMNNFPFLCFKSEMDNSLVSGKAMCRLPKMSPHLPLSYAFWGTNPSKFQRCWYVARQFSIRYIWIDTLYIIQDSKEDWEIESPMMRHVYSNSVCTIAASGSGTSDDSLFHDRDLDFIKAGKVKSSLCTGEANPYYLRDRSYFERQILEGGLRTRGWVFKEWFLLPRILHFSRH